MARNTTTPTKPNRILTPDELELAEALSKALVNKIGADLALRNADHEIGRLTGEINKLGFVEQDGKARINHAGRARATVIWTEAREMAGFPAAPAEPHR